MTKPIIVSGMQPTGKIHLGNYLGALKNWVDLQNQNRYASFFFVADYHSLTENYDPVEKKEQIFDLFCDFLAVGLDPEKSVIFVQSQAPECAELAWIFNTLTPMGELERMTQFKDKAKRQMQNVNTGLLTYPILQAADILLYRGELVPVGQDQVQHVELTRDCAKWFNKKYGTDFFAEAKPLLTPTPKIMSLLTPENKMSKSLGDKHCLNIDDEPAVIEQKLAKAVSTPEGIANLKAIYDALASSMPGAFDADKMAATKKIMARGVANYLQPLRDKKAALKENRPAVFAAMARGQAQARPIAQKTLKKVKEIIGVLN